MSVVKGRCPDAWHPMEAGDGLLVRVRPSLGRLDGAQLRGLCEAAMAFGNGLIDLTSRANLQIRGVSAQAWPLLVERLKALALIHADPIMEMRRAILVSPDWTEGDDTVGIARELAARLAELPTLPAKVGFIVDTKDAPLLIGEMGDFRIERGAHGGLILRADGRPTGVAVEPGDAVDQLIRLATWFLASGGADAGRMVRHRAPLPGWAQGALAPARVGMSIRPGSHPLGFAYAVPFGTVEAATLAQLGNVAVRLTPWRILIVEGGAGRTITGLSSDRADPLLRVDACPGAPRCPQASVETRALARRIAPHVAGGLHVSGCAKGCARAAPAELCVTGREGRYDLARDARAGAPPQRAGMDAAALLDYLGAD